ncbi:MAG: T9SS type A sorting domain-containing protein [candidate division Zixibacteria bacterium]|nr:T9SS type A sorting domain-containing protein [candidate division Zixibacteria bacterium]
MNMKNCILISSIIGMLISILTLPGIAQDTLWTRTYGGSGFEPAYDIQVTEDSGFILACDDLILKTNSLGHTVWTFDIEKKSYPEFRSVCRRDGGYMVAGTTTGPYSTDFWLISMTYDGDTLWSKIFPDNYNGRARCIDVTYDGGNILAGDRIIDPGPPSDVDFFVIKTNDEGDTIWTHTYGTFGEDYLYDIQQTTDYGYIMAGRRSNADAAYLVKTDENGDELWYILEMEGWSSVFNSVKQTIDGGYIAAGGKEFWGYPYYPWKFYLVKYDSQGNKEWERAYEEEEFWTSEAEDVYQTIDGGYIMVGYVSIPYEQIASYVIRTDSNGDTLWTWICDEPDINNSFLTLTAVNESEFAAAGYYDDSVWLAKFQEPSYCCEVDMVPDDDPIIVQPGESFRYTGTLINPTEFSLAFDVWVGVIYEENFFQTRLFEGTEPLEPGEFLTRHFRQSVPNYAPIGDYRYVAYGGNYPSKCDSVWFDFTVEGAPLADGNTEWSVQELYTGAEEGISKKSAPTLRLDGSPNPFNASTRIEFALPSEGHTKLEIYDLLGKRVEVLINEDLKAGNHSVTWNAERFASGIYFCRLTQGSLRVTKKMGLVK